MKAKFKNWVAKNSEMLEKDFVEECSYAFEEFCKFKYEYEILEYEG